MDTRAGRAIAAALTAALALSACGGGSSGDAAATTTTAPGAVAVTPSGSSPPSGAAPSVAVDVEGEISKDEYILRADALCAGLLDRFDDIEIEGKDRAELLVLLDDLSFDFGTTVKQLRALPRPDGDPSGAVAMIESYGEVARALRGIDAGARRAGNAALAHIERYDALGQVEAQLGEVAGANYGFRTCAADDVPSIDPTGDAAVQIDLRDALAAEKLVFLDRQAFTEKARILDAVEPDLQFVRSLRSMTARPGLVYVELADDRSVYLGAQSASGSCFWVRDAEPAEGSAGEEQPEITYSTATTCSDRPAAVTFVGNRLDAAAWPSAGSAQGQAEQAEQVRFD